MNLGTPFIGLIQPFMVDETGIETNIMGAKIIFKVIHKPITRNVNILKEISNQKIK